MRYVGTSASERLPSNTLVQLTFSERNSFDYVGWFNSQFATNFATAIPLLASKAGVIATTPSNAVSGETAATIDAVIKASRTSAESVNAINAVLPSSVGLDTFEVKRRDVVANPADGTDYSTNSPEAAAQRAAATDSAKKKNFLDEVMDSFSSFGSTVKYVAIVAVLLFVWIKAKE